MNEYGTMVDSYKHRKTEVLEENPTWCYYVHQKSHINRARASAMKSPATPGLKSQMLAPLSSQYPKFYQVWFSCNLQFSCLALLYDLEEKV